MEDEGEAIRALGHLFKTTKVFLWDDARGGQLKTTSCRDIPSVGVSPDSTGFNNPDNSLACTSGRGNEEAITLDSELAQEIAALGLPVSFSTNKEKRKAGIRGKQKGKRSSKNLSSQVLELRSKDLVGSYHDQVFTCDSEAASLNAIDYEKSNFRVISTENQTRLSVDLIHLGDEVVKPSEIFEQLPCEVNDELSESTISCISENESRGSFSNTIFLDSYNLASENHDLICVEDDSALSICFQFDHKQEKNTISEPSYGLNHSGHTKKELNEMGVEKGYCSESSESIQNPVLLRFSMKCDNCTCPDDLGNWMAAWDTHYMRSYYYNIQTEESTWNCPLCRECLAVLSNSDGTLVGATDYGTHGIFENTSSGESQNTKDSFLEAECLVVPSNSNGAHVGETEESSFTDFTTKIVEDAGSSRLLNLGLFLEAEGDKLPFQSNNHINPKLNIAIGDQVSEYSIFSAWDSLQQLKDHQTMLPDDNYNATSLSLASEVNSASTKHHQLGTQETFYKGLDSYLSQTDDYPNSIFCSASTKKHLKKIKSRQQIKCDGSCDSMLPEEMEGFSFDITKYWCQRYLLFSRFDMGVKLDEEGWFSVTPEVIAQHHAARCSTGIVIDCFAGVGGNAIQFAMKSSHVIAIDIDPCKIDYARHNATIYGVQDNIDFVHGDFFQLASKLKGDAVFLSPPWGGPDYLKAEIFDLLMLKPHDGYFLFKIACNLAPKVVMFLPRNVNLNQLAKLSQMVHPPLLLEVEKNYLNGKLKAITAYFTVAS